MYEDPHFFFVIALCYELQACKVVTGVVASNNAICHYIHAELSRHFLSKQCMVPL